MKIIIFGASGMLGRVLKNQYQEEELITPSHAECDFLQKQQIRSFIDSVQPDIVINAAAIVNIDACEKDKDTAFNVNGLAVAEIAMACNQCNAYFVQISTDHYYINDGNLKHTEEDPLHLVNYYAQTKFMGETYALLAKKHLIIRTNIIGFKSIKNQPTFLEWAINKIVKKEKMDLFFDYFTSSIDIYHFSEILRLLIKNKICGTFNIGSNDVSSKSDFILKLALKMKISIKEPNICSIFEKTNLIKRANSIGLDVKKVESVLNQPMPSSEEVIQKILEVYNDQYKNQF